MDHLKAFPLLLVERLVVGALLHEGGHVLPEYLGDHLARDLLVLDGISKERCHHEVGVAPMGGLRYQTGDLQQMGDVGLLGGSLAFLVDVPARSGIGSLQNGDPFLH